MTAFGKSLDELEGELRPLLSALDGLRAAGDEEEVDALSRARAHITLAYAANSLFCMYLRTQGVDPATHPVADEITRVQEAFMRMRKVQAGLDAGHQKPPDRDRRKHIQAVKRSEAKLSALVLPEERDLVRALYDIRKRPRTAEGTAAEGGADSSDENDGLAHVRLTDEELTSMHRWEKVKEGRERKKQDIREMKVEKKKRKIEKEKEKKREKRKKAKKNKKAKAAASTGEAS